MYDLDSDRQVTRDEFVTSIKKELGEVEEGVIDDAAIQDMVDQLLREYAEGTDVMTFNQFEMMITDGP